MPIVLPFGFQSEFDLFAYPIIIVVLFLLLWHLTFLQLYPRSSTKEYKPKLILVDTILS